MSLREEIDAFWRRFLFVKGLDKSVQWQDCFHFDTTPAGAERALGLVLSGVKQATVTSLEAFQRLGLRPPKRGDLSIVTTWEGVPRCVIQTVSVLIQPYSAFTEEQALLEGEDTTLEGWRIRQRNLLIAEARELSYVFAPTQSLVQERFRVVYVDEEIRGEALGGTLGERPLLSEKPPPSHPPYIPPSLREGARGRRFSLEKRPPPEYLSFMIPFSGFDFHAAVELL